MCGILLDISACRDERNNPGHPELFSDYLKEIGGETTYESDDYDKIQAELIIPNLQNDLVLSMQDQLKLDSIDRLRELNLQLMKLNNNIKKKKDEAILLQKQAIETEIDTITNQQPLDDDDEEDVRDVFESLVRRVASRGPDYVLYQQLYHQQRNIRLFSSILSLRQPFAKQPITDHGFKLQFNGELYNSECLDGNDTDFIMNRLVSNLEATKDRQSAVSNTISELNGEFAFIIIDLKLGLVYFGKDFVGKRSLLYSLNEQSLTISSLAPIDNSKVNYIECESSEIKIFDLKKFSLSSAKYIRPPIKFLPLSCSDNGQLGSKVGKLHQILHNACLIRQSTIHPLHTIKSQSGALMGVLFSGGLDCTIISALLSENVVGPGAIDLITVGFDNPRTNLSAKESPDRKLSKKSWFHLAKKYPKVSIRLIEINVSYKEWLVNKKRVKKLMYPTDTEMDLSIAIAFYFASKCENGTKIELNERGGQVEFDEFITRESEFTVVEQGYTSNAKVLFSGLGADELFAGYSRHESIFNDIEENTSEEKVQAKYGELSTSLIYDIKAIYVRNLGRDDRVISSWGKELRYPYLDNQLINHVINEIEPNFKLKYEWQLRTTKRDKVGKQVKVFVRKWILRELAEAMGLDFVKDELKRAIQFGAKSAKLEIGQNRTKGTDQL